MDALPETTTVWVAEDPRSDVAKKALDEWVRGRGARITRAQPNRTVTVDRSISVQIESELAKAKDAILAGETERAEARLAAVSTLVRLHPELTEAAWLRAEVDRAWATRFVRLEPKDPARALSWLLEAEGLDGGRRAGLGEPEAPRPETIGARFEWSVDSRFEVWLDARLLSPGDKRSTVGEHHLLVTRRGRPVWSGWVALADGTQIQVPTPLPEPCSEEDLDASGRSTARCPSWLTVKEGANSIDVAECHGPTCGRPTRLPLQPRQRAPSDAHPWPAWATWSALGVAAVAITTVGLVAGGAFEPAPRETRFINGGTRTSAFPGLSFR